MRHFTLLIFSVFFLAFSSCKDDEVDGIVIGDTLYVHQDYEANKRFRHLIEDALDRDGQAVVELTDFPCGGGAGCYDLGFVLTQIIYRLGEKEFIEMVGEIEQGSEVRLRGMVSVGLEYGDHDGDGKTDNRRTEDEFPMLDGMLR